MENLTAFFCVCFILQIITNLIILKRYLVSKKKKRRRIDISRLIVPEQIEED